MRNYTTYIDENECIGDSLDTINTNFETLDTGFNTAFVCEVSGAGVIGNYMAHSVTIPGSKGICMPYSGELLKAALQVYDITGTVAVRPAVNNIANADYQLTTTGTNLTGSQLSAYATPLTFNAGDTFGWVISSVPSSAKGYNITYVVHFYM